MSDQSERTKLLSQLEQAVHTAQASGEVGPAADPGEIATLMVAAADGLITNFHLPGSSLLMLVAAFAGEEAWRAAYDEAVSSRLAFYSYGDAMLIRPAREDRS